MSRPADGPAVTTLYVHEVGDFDARGRLFVLPRGPYEIREFLFVPLDPVAGSGDCGEVRSAVLNAAGQDLDSVSPREGTVVRRRLEGGASELRFCPSARTATIHFPVAVQTPSLLFLRCLVPGRLELRTVPVSTGRRETDDPFWMPLQPASLEPEEQVALWMPADYSAGPFRLPSV